MRRNPKITPMITEIKMSIRKRNLKNIKKKNIVPKNNRKTPK